MKREHFYALVIIVLLLLNISTLAFLWMERSEGDRFMPLNSPEHIIINKLQLNKEQQQEFNVFKHSHRKSIDSVGRHIKEAQMALFDLVKMDELDIELRDSLLSRIEQYESAKHLITIQHFHDIRSMLKPEQKGPFNEFVDEIGSSITGSPPMLRPPPRH